MADSEIAEQQAPVTAQAEMKTGTGRLAAASSVGTALEWYDFTVYNIMAALVFNHVFFPSFDPLVGTILAFSTYAVGYISRPVGGLIFGHLGDVAGRKCVLITTLLIMGGNHCADGVAAGLRCMGYMESCSARHAAFYSGSGIRRRVGRGCTFVHGARGYT